MQWIIDEIIAAKGQPILFTSSTYAFCAGADLKEISHSSAPEILEYVTVMEELYDTLLAHSAPTVAAVNGHATGGGLLLFLCCDFAYCSDQEGLYIGLPEVSAGVLVSPKLMNLFKQLMPFLSLRKMLLSAELLSPQKALQLHLFDGIGPNVEELARNRLEQLSELPKEVYAETKKELITPQASQQEFEQKIHSLVDSGSLKEHMARFMK